METTTKWNIKGFSEDLNINNHPPSPDNVGVEGNNTEQTQAPSKESRQHFSKNNKRKFSKFKSFNPGEQRSEELKQINHLTGNFHKREFYQFTQPSNSDELMFSKNTLASKFIDNKKTEKTVENFEALDAATSTLSEATGAGLKATIGASTPEELAKLAQKIASSPASLNMNGIKISVNAKGEVDTSGLEKLAKLSIIDWLNTIITLHEVGTDENKKPIYKKIPDFADKELDAELESNRMGFTYSGTSGACLAGKKFKVDTPDLADAAKTVKGEQDTKGFTKATAQGVKDLQKNIFDNVVFGIIKTYLKYFEYPFIYFKWFIKKLGIAYCRLLTYIFNVPESNDDEKRLVISKINSVMSLLVSILITYNWFFLMFYHYDGEKPNLPDINSKMFKESSPLTNFLLEFILYPVDWLNWVMLTLFPKIMKKIVTNSTLLFFVMYNIIYGINTEYAACTIDLFYDSFKILLNHSIKPWDDMMNHTYSDGKTYSITAKTFWFFHILIFGGQIPSLIPSFYEAYAEAKETKTEGGLAEGDVILAETEKQPTGEEETGNVGEEKVGEEKVEEEKVEEEKVEEEGGEGNKTTTSAVVPSTLKKNYEIIPKQLSPQIIPFLEKEGYNEKSLKTLINSVQNGKLWKGNFQRLSENIKAYMIPVITTQLLISQPGYLNNFLKDPIEKNVDWIKSKKLVNDYLFGDIKVDYYKECPPELRDISKLNIPQKLEELLKIVIDYKQDINYRLTVWKNYVAIIEKCNETAKTDGGSESENQAPVSALAPATAPVAAGDLTKNPPKTSGGAAPKNIGQKMARGTIAAAGTLGTQFLSGAKHLITDFLRFFISHYFVTIAAMLFALYLIFYSLFGISAFSSMGLFSTINEINKFIRKTSELAKVEDKCGISQNCRGTAFQRTLRFIKELFMNIIYFFANKVYLFLIVIVLFYAGFQYYLNIKTSEALRNSLIVSDLLMIVIAVLVYFAQIFMYQQEES